MKLEEEDVVKHNRHILSVSGGDFGLFQKGELGYIIDSVNDEANPLDQAATFLFYCVNNHPFLNGNKRTAFEISKGLLASGGWQFQASEQEVIGFITGSVAQGKANREETKDWFSSHMRPSETMEFNQITSQNIEKDKKLLKKLD